MSVEEGSPAIAEPKLPTLAATHHDLDVLCGIDGEKMKFVGSPDPDKRRYRCECGNEARADALEAFAMGAGAYLGASVIVNPVDEPAAVTPAPEDDRPGPDWKAIP